MNGFAPEEVTQRGADPAAAAAAAAVVGNAGSAVEVPPPPAPPGLGLTAAAAGATGAGGAGGPGAGQLCCLREEGERCGRAAGNASFSKRIQKSISQKKVKIELDKSVSLGRGIRGTAAPHQRGLAVCALAAAVCPAPNALLRGLLRLCLSWFGGF